MFEQVHRLFRHRLLIQALVSRDLKARYRGSVLGFLWSFINPLLLLLTYGFVFTYMLPMLRTPETDPYFLFLFCGILPWSWFNAAVLESSGVLMAGSNLIKKVLFPAEVLPVVNVLANLVHFMLGLPIVLLCLAFFGRLSPTLLLLPLPMLAQLLLTLGVALFVSALTVHFRDIQNILGHLLHLLFFATPILYYYADPRFLQLKRVLRWNPMTHIVFSYQQILLHGHFDHWRGLLLAIGLGALVFVAGALFFDRLRDTLAEEV
jgi:ABC-type polysaccharide/polyol phosphate export permease